MKVKETAKKPYGICPASMTIWNADQTYNKKGMEKYLTWLLDNGAQSISICGSTGENVAMNMEEQREIIGHVASFLNGQVPLICGTGRYDTLNTIKMSKYAQDCGADGVMVILPYYLNPHKKAVMQHFRDIRAALDIRMMIYNNPWFASYEMTVPEIEELVNDGTIQDIKAQNNIQPYIDYFFHDKVDGVPHWQEICKYTLQAQGLDFAGLPRKPLGELDAANKKKVEKLLADMD